MQLLKANGHFLPWAFFIKTCCQKFFQKTLNLGYENKAVVINSIKKDSQTGFARDESMVAKENIDSSKPIEDEVG